VVVVDEDGFDLALAGSSPDVAFAVVVIDEDGFDLALVLRGSDGSSWMLAASVEASERMGRT